MFTLLRSPNQVRISDYNIVQRGDAFSVSETVDFVHKSLIIEFPEHRTQRSIVQSFCGQRRGETGSRRQILNN